MLRLLSVRTCLAVGLLWGCTVKAQLTDATAIEFNNLINDAVFFTDLYITPATDAAVYQAASGWIVTPQKRKLWDYTIGLNVNSFIVPQSDRTFTVSDSDFSFFTIDGATSATTPSALGDDQFVTLNGELNGQPIVLKSPEGIDRTTVVYPYVQGSVGLLYGTELVMKYAPKTTLKHVVYQVYGAGLKHNLSQYFRNVEKHNVHFAALLAYSKEDISVGFLDVQTEAYGNLGLNSLNSVIDTWQFQVNGSKVFKALELSAGFIVNTSDFEYAIDGKKGDIEQFIPLRQILNSRLYAIRKTKWNYIGEFSTRYNFKPFLVQATFAFGKFVNSNLALQYEF